MKKLTIPSNITRAVHKSLFQLKKHSPEILTGIGTIGTVVGAVMACKATLKVHEITDQAKKDINDINKAVETGKTKAGEDYTVEDSKKDLTLVYTQTGIKFVKLYAPAVIIGGLSLTAILTAHKIMHTRNIALAAAYMSEHTALKEYRDRVVERFGKELDQELRYNIKAKEIEETVVNEDGSESKVKKTIKIIDTDGPSEYAQFFDESSAYWEKDAEYNRLFLLQQQTYANDLLRMQGYLFLNDVWKMLGLPITKAGQHVGWVYNGDGKYCDSYVDFNIFDVTRRANREFVNGLERCVLIDPNVDGDIYELMK